MKRNCRFLCLFFLLTAVLPAMAGRSHEQALIANVTAFHEALLAKDSVVLRKLLSPNLRYGHSNGWVQTMEDVIADLYDGKLTYTRIFPIGLAPSVVIEGNTGLV